MRRLLKEKHGEGFVDVCVLVLSVALVLALVVRIAPVFVAKQNLDVFADELERRSMVVSVPPPAQKRRLSGRKPDLTRIFHGATPGKSNLATR